MASAATAMFGMLMTAAVAAPALAFTTYEMDELLDFLLARLTDFNDRPLEAKVFACKRVVQVYAHMLVGDFDNTSHEVVAVLVLKGQHGSHFHIVVVEMPVDGENLAVKVHHTFLFVCPVCLLFGQREVELVTILQGSQFLLESFECHAEAADEYKRMVSRCLLNQHFRLCRIIQPVGYGDKFLLFLFFQSYYNSSFSNTQIIFFNNELHELHEFFYSRQHLFLSILSTSAQPKLVKSEYQS